MMCQNKWIFLIKFPRNFQNYLYEIRTKKKIKEPKRRFSLRNLIKNIINNGAIWSRSNLWNIRTTRRSVIFLSLGAASTDAALRAMRRGAGILLCWLKWMIWPLRRHPHRPNCSTAAFGILNISRSAWSVKPFWNVKFCSVLCPIFLGRCDLFCPIIKICVLPLTRRLLGFLAGCFHG